MHNNFVLSCSYYILYDGGTKCLEIDNTLSDNDGCVQVAQGDASVKCNGAGEVEIDFIGTDPLGQVSAPLTGVTKIACGKCGMSFACILQSLT